MLRVRRAKACSGATGGTSAVGAGGDTDGCPEGTPAGAGVPGAGAASRTALPVAASQRWVGSSLEGCDSTCSAPLQRIRRTSPHASASAFVAKRWALYAQFFSPRPLTPTRQLAACPSAVGSGGVPSGGAGGAEGTD